MPDPQRDLLRHVVATIAYRGAKALRGAPESFGDFRASESTRTPVEILAHMGDLFDWVLTIARGEQVWRDAAPLAWSAECERFFPAFKFTLEDARTPAESLAAAMLECAGEA